MGAANCMELIRIIIVYEATLCFVTFFVATRCDINEGNNSGNSELYNMHEETVLDRFWLDNIQFA